MKAIRLVFATLLALLMVLGATPVSANGVPALPHAFYGSVTINGESAPVGTVISAGGAGVESGTLQNPVTTTVEGSYGMGGGLKLLVQAEAGSTVTFYVNGISTGQTASFQSGNTSRVNLSVTIEYTLTVVSSSGGSVTAPGEGSFDYNAGTVVDLVADPASGYRFRNWSGDTATIADTDDPTTTITMDDDCSIRANFSRISTTTPTTTLTVEELETDFFGTEGGYDINSDGEILETITATSEDGYFSFTIPEGTTALDEDGNPLTNLEVEVNENPPDPPEGAHIIGLPYTFSPAGATFDPPIIFEYSYNDADIPEGVDEENLTIAYYDESLSPPHWVELECEVDTDNNIITAYVDHFTTFALIVPDAAPAQFLISDISIVPAEVQSGETVAISATLTNIGGSEGALAISLKINGEVEEEQSITLAAGASQEVSFNVIREEPGTYSISLGGLGGSFTVTAAATPTETATPTTILPTETVTTTQPPETVTETTTSPPETVTATKQTTITYTETSTGDGTNWPLIGGLIAGAVVLAGLLVYVLDRRRGY